MQVRVAAPPGCSPEELGAKHPNGLNDGVWSVELVRFDIAAVRFAAGDVRLSAPRRRSKRRLVRRLQAAILDLQNRRNALDNPPPLSGLNNPSFEAPLRGALIPGWTVNGARAGGHHHQRCILRAASPAIDGQRPGGFASERSVASDRDGPLGGLAVDEGSCRRRPAAAATDLGRSLRWAAILSHGAVGGLAGAVLIPEVWKQFIFSVDDLPPDRVTQLRFRLDLQGASDVLVDDVQLFDLVFNDAEKIHLNKIIALAEFQLNQGQLGDCLDSWGVTGRSCSARMCRCRRRS